MEWLTLLSLLAAVTAAYLSWRQLHKQQERWAIDEARIRPRGYVGSSEIISEEGWFHGVWSVTNRAPFEIEVIEAVALFPASLEIAELEPGFDGPVQLMRAMNRGKILKVNQIMSPYKFPEKSDGGDDNFCIVSQGRQNLIEAGQFTCRLTVESLITRIKDTRSSVKQMSLNSLSRLLKDNFITITQCGQVMAPLGDIQYGASPPEQRPSS